MARVKISEYTAKTILNRELGSLWKGIQADNTTDVKDIVKAFGAKKLVIKVDQGIKQRGKQGLVGVNLLPVDCISFIEEKSKLGYSSFLIEELVSHDQKDEHYLSIERVREGMRVLYSEKGGVEVEENWGSIQEYVVSRNGRESRVASRGSNTEVSLRGEEPDVRRSNLVEKLILVMDRYHFSFLETNPLVSLPSSVSRLQSPDSQLPATNYCLLDSAVLVDDAGYSIGLNPIGFNPQGLAEQPAEKRVRELDATTPASLKLKIINPHGSIWMLLSGGGASLVLADEVADLGYGQELGNYGEYSGSPSTEDTYLYTKVILEAMLNSKAENKVLIIAGGVANFTDVVKTFKGIIQALQESVTLLQNQRVKVFVRRGGPNQEKGLALMKDFPEKNGILGYVAGPELVLTEIVQKAIKNLKFKI